jgi:hypothetical protein
MSKKRRKIDKIRAQRHFKKKLSVKKVSPILKSKIEKKEFVVKEKTSSLFNYDPRLIAQDLKKTLLITLVVLLVLALISLRYT